MTQYGRSDGGGESDDEKHARRGGDLPAGFASFALIVAAGGDAERAPRADACAALGCRRDARLLHVDLGGGRAQRTCCAEHAIDLLDLDVDVDLGGGDADGGAA